MQLSEIIWNTNAVETFKNEIPWMLLTLDHLVYDYIFTPRMNYSIVISETLLL